MNWMKSETREHLTQKWDAVKMEYFGALLFLFAMVVLAGAYQGYRIRTLEKQLVTADSLIKTLDGQLNTAISLILYQQKGGGHVTNPPQGIGGVKPLGGGGYPGNEIVLSYPDSCEKTGTGIYQNPELVDADVTPVPISGGRPTAQKDTATTKKQKKISVNISGKNPPVQKKFGLTGKTGSGKWESEHLPKNPKSSDLPAPLK